VSEQEWNILADDEMNLNQMQKKKHDQWVNKLESKTVVKKKEEAKKKKKKVVKKIKEVNEEPVEGWEQDESEDDFEDNTDDKETKEKQNLYKTNPLFKLVDEAIEKLKKKFP
jgi:hypothetical protein